MSIANINGEAINFDFRLKVRDFSTIKIYPFMLRFRKTYEY
jgi:hypothetical protein